ncbi:putative Latrophilin Cirl [Daphnia magna]|uniref:Putative Latrophilin Cirl n=1 Tax=Daphnia magna TaxID=35525 RepID=A0A164YD43_9CRUS|nr:putative Latrophilin Cirl [Daphnia magna]
MINSTRKPENGSSKLYGRDSGNGSSEQNYSSPHQQQQQTSGIIY